MSVVLAIPVGVDATGGARLSSSDEDAEKTIRLALADNDSDHAFQQDIGLGTGHVFDVRNSAFRVRVLTRLFSIFDRFEADKLFRLDRSSIRWVPGVDPGEQELEFRYINLETDDPRTFRRSFKAGPDRD